MSEGFGCLITLLVFGGALAVVLHLIHEGRKAREQTDAEIRAAAAARATNVADALAHSWLDIKACFPFLRTPKLPDPTPEAIVEAALDEIERNGTLGKSLRHGIGAPLLPLPARLRHLYVVGRTGSGKSTFLEHLFFSDVLNEWGLGVIAPESEFFLDRLMPLIPVERWDDVVYFAPGDRSSPHTFNPLALEPGEDATRAAEDLFTILSRIFTEEELGPRMAPLLQNSLALLVGRPGMSLEHVKRLLEDAAFREHLVDSERDDYVRSFWLNTYPRFPKNADLPVLTRLDRFLRPPEVRQVLCAADSTFSIRQALAGQKILLVNLYGLAQENRELYGQLVLSKLQLELMRRELSGDSSPPPFLLYADEFQSFAGIAEGTWRELLSRGRKYKLGLVLAHQYPAQLPTAVQDEILGNVSSIVAFGVGGKDAHIVRRELLEDDLEKGELVPISATRIIDQKVGHAFVRYAGGHTTQVLFPPPLEVPAHGEALRTFSWRDIAPAASAPREQRGPRPPDEPEEPGTWRG